MAQKQPANDARGELALVRAALSSLRGTRARFWRGPGLIVLIVSVLEIFCRIVVNQIIHANGGSLTISPGSTYAPYLGQSPQFWIFASSFSHFVAQAAVAWAWLNLALLASRRLADLFADAAAPGLELSLPLRFRAAVSFALPALWAYLAAQLLGSIVLVAMQPSLLSGALIGLMPFSLLVMAAPLYLPLLLITAVWLAAPRWGLLLSLCAFAPTAGLWRDLYMLSGLGTLPAQSLPGARLDLYLPGGQLYALGFILLMLWCLVRFRAGWTRLPVALLSLALLADKLSNSFYSLSLPVGPGGGASLSAFNAPAGMWLLASLRAMVDAATELPYYVNVWPGTAATLIFTAFPLLVLPLQSWFADLLLCLSPLYAWLLYFALQRILRGAARDIITDHK